MPHNFYAIIPHPHSPQILLQQTEGGWTIPLFQLKSSWTPYVAYINDAVKEQFNINAVVRYTPHVQVERPEGQRQVSVIYVLLPPPADWTPHENTRWATLDEYRSLSVANDWPTPHIEAYFADEQSGVIPALRPPWGRKGWYEEISDWVSTQLALHNIHLKEPLHQLKQWDISSVLKAPTDNGDIYVKAIPAYFASEPRITAGLARIFPGIVPDPIATWEQPNEGRIIMRDFGGKLLWMPDTGPSIMEEALRIFARMQISCATRNDELTAIGCGDRRIQGLPGDLLAILADEETRARITEDEVARLQAIRPTLEELVERLSALPVPQTLLHGDFHPGNVAITDTGYVIFDWTDACISHPFFDLITVVDNGDEPMSHEQRETYLAAYLGEWQAAGYGTAESLRETCDLALKLAPLYHAISYRNIDRIGEQAMHAELGGSFPLFLRMLLDRLETK
ncbi:MAG: aminoglycoside phosphotransferase family protein [Chloroflexia bacterium]